MMSLFRQAAASVTAGQIKGLAGKIAINAFIRLLHHNDISIKGSDGCQKSIETSQEIFHWLRSEVYPEAEAAFKEKYQGADKPSPTESFKYQKTFYIFGVFPVATITLVLPIQKNASDQFEINPDWEVEFAAAPGREQFFATNAFGTPFASADSYSASVANERALIHAVNMGFKAELLESISKMANNLTQHWQTDQSLEVNVVTMLFKAMLESVFDIKGLADSDYLELYHCIDDFEKFWLEPDKFDAEKYRKLDQRLQALSKKMLDTQPENIKSQEFMQSLLSFLQSRGVGFHDTKDINIAYFLTLFSNLPKALIGIFYCVLFNDEHVALLQEENHVIEGKVAVGKVKAINHVLQSALAFQKENHSPKTLKAELTKAKQQLEALLKENDALQEIPAIKSIMERFKAAESSKMTHPERQQAIGSIISKIDQLDSIEDTAEARLKYLESHSEIYNCMIAEIYRFWPIVAVVPRRTQMLFHTEVTNTVLQSQAADTDKSLQEFDPRRAGLVTKKDNDQIKREVNPFTRGQRRCPAGDGLVETLLLAFMQAMSQPVAQAQLREFGSVTAEVPARSFKPHIAGFADAAKLVGMQFDSAVLQKQHARLGK